MTSFGDQLADEIMEADNNPNAAVYRAKLPSVRRLQSKGMPDGAIEQALGIKLEEADRSRVRVGLPEQLELRIEWDRPTRRGRAALDVGGKLELVLGPIAIGPRLGRHSVWRFRPGELLGKLAKSWMPLILEGSNAADAAIDGRPGEIRLAGVLKHESHARSLTLAREGLQLTIEIGQKEWQVDFNTALPILEHLGELLFSRFSGDNEPIAEVKSWLTRDKATDDEALAIAAGSPDWPVKDHLTKLLNIAQQKFDLAKLVRQPLELVVLARMLPRGLPSPEINRILDVVSAAPKSAVQKRIQDLSQAAATFIKSKSELKDYEQGYVLACWFREELGFGPLTKVEPLELLQSWGVSVEERKFAPAVDSIAVWGTSHGPYILVNRNGIHARTRGGYRATMAHELCHLLIDRHAALPVLEVLGGRVPKKVEARARAFAAEFLVPREQAAHITRQSQSIGAAVDQIQEAYDASVQLCAWQIMNSDVQLSIRDRSSLRRLAEQNSVLLQQS